MKAEPLFKPSTIRPVTETDYLKKIASIRAYSVRKRTLVEDEPASPSFTDAVGDLASREDITIASRAAYRAAALWFARSGKVTDRTDLQGALAILEQMEARPPRKGTRGIPRSISEKDLGILLDHLHKKQESSAWALRTALWIKATLVTGARPIEWLHAAWHPDQPDSLRIRNAKTKASAPAFMRSANTPEETESETEQITRLEDTELARLIAQALSEEELAQDQLAFEGEEDGIEHTFREIKISSEADRRIVQLHLQSIHSAAPLGIPADMRYIAFKRAYAQCAMFLMRACKAIWAGKKTYSLYTMRGQFAANMKAQLGVAAAAELMGHSREDSPAVGHYGKGSQAFARFKSSKAPERQSQMPMIPKPGEAQVSSSVE